MDRQGNREKILMSRGGGGAVHISSGRDTVNPSQQFGSIFVCTQGAVETAYVTCASKLCVISSSA
jgi:hypothetical protein